MGLFPLIGFTIGVVSLAGLGNKPSGKTVAGAMGRLVATGLTIMCLSTLLFTPIYATTVTEYLVPGNPGLWDVAVNSTHVWFTESASNNIGVLSYMVFSPSVKQIPVPTPNSQPWGIAKVPWISGSAVTEVVFTEAYANRIGMVVWSSNNSTYSVVEYRIPTEGSSPRKIIYDRRWNCTWFTEYIGKIGCFNTTNGGGWAPKFIEYALPSGSTPIGIAADPNELYIWYADFSRRAIGRLDPGSPTRPAQVREYPVAPFSPWDVAVDPDGMVWFTAQEVGTDRNSICRLDPVASDRPYSKYSLAVFRVPTPNSEVREIDIDNRTGNVWFTEFSDYASKIGRYSPLSNIFSEYAIITPGAKPQGLSVFHEAATGVVNVWFAEYGGRRIGRLRQPEGPTVTSTVYSISSAVSTSTTITMLTSTWSASKTTTTTPITSRIALSVTPITVFTASSTLVDTVSTALTSPTYTSMTYTYTTSTSYTTTTTTYKLTLVTIETTSTTTSVTATYVSTSWESISLQTTSTVLSISWFSETTSTTMTTVQTSTVFSPTITVPTTTTTGITTTIYSPTVTLTSTTHTGTTTTTTSTILTTTTAYSPTVTLTSTTTTLTTAFQIEALRPCIIASAAYGSELAEPVQSLREFRDHKVQSTFAGAEFMKVFNSFYYSFSPKVASIVASSQFVAAPVRLLLYPLIHILQTSSTIFGALTSAPDVGVIVAGVFSSALLGIVYITPTALGIQYLLKKKSNVKRLEVTPVAERRAEQE